MTQCLVCFVTIDNPDTALEMARSLVQQGLVACVNIVPQVKSVYRWKGELCEEAEHLMIMKTRQSLFSRLSLAVKSMHPYEVPEVVAIDIAQGLPDYLSWIEDSTCVPL
ncbi:MAG: divalent-cation tolerance protein CutA [Thermodesulfobacteriota bacterium]